jgi:hypothetical protein
MDGMLNLQLFSDFFWQGLVIGKLPDAFCGDALTFYRKLF